MSESVESMSLSSGEAPTGPDAIDSDTALESVTDVDEDVNSVSPSEEVSELKSPESALESVAIVHDEINPVHADEKVSEHSAAPLPESTSGPELGSLPNRIAMETNPTSEPQVESVQSKDSISLQRDVAPASEDPTSSNGDLELGENIVVLLSKSSAPGGQCCVYLVGTAHVSQESCDEVQKVIRHVKPQVVFVELCTSRASMLRPQTLQIPTFEEMIKMYRTKGMNPFGIIYSWFLAKVADKLEVFPGAEFRVAYDEALACGARVFLGDRPVQITLRRTWARMSIWHKTKLILTMIFEGFFMPGAEDLNQMVKQMKDTDMITAIIQEMSKTFPTLMDTLVYERDLYMTASLRGVAQHCATAVAVVGKGHLQGITKNWEKNISIETLMTVPEKRPSWFSRTAVRWGALTIAAGGLAIIIGVHLNQKS